MTPCGLTRDHGVANQVGSVMMKTILGFGVSVAALMAASAASATVDLNFEGINSTYPSGFAFINGFMTAGRAATGPPAPITA
jgi:hypothetical protein